MDDTLQIKLTEKEITILSPHIKRSGEISEFFTEVHKLRLWLGNDAEKTNFGFSAKIVLALHTIHLEIRPLQHQPSTFRFLVSSNYLPEKSLVVVQVVEDQDTLQIIFKEHAEFANSRWKKAQEIHSTIWKESLQRLIRVYSEIP